ncbi:hypothetical protein [Acinetobacter phage Ab69]|nr:hypothetical protein [Acinetobacter phage Ab69]
MIKDLNGWLFSLSCSVIDGRKFFHYEVGRQRRIDILNNIKEIGKIFYIKKVDLEIQMQHSEE